MYETTHTYTYVYTAVYTTIYTYACMHTYMCVYVFRSYIHAYVQALTFSQTHLDTHTHTHTHTQAHQLSESHHVIGKIVIEMRGKGGNAPATNQGEKASKDLDAQMAALLARNKNKPGGVLHNKLPPSGNYAGK